MGTCAMTVIHHGLCHPGITLELQHRPADVGHAAKASGDRDDPHNLPSPPNKCCLLPALLYTQASTNRLMRTAHVQRFAH